MRARPFDSTDAAAVAEIYNQGIAERNATFETEARTAEAIAKSLGVTSSYPAVVVERDGAIIAAAWASEYRRRRAYDGIAEFSVYVAGRARGQSVGRLALSALIEAAEARGFWKLVSRIFPENVGSRRLCAALGFREVGVYRRHGREPAVRNKARACVIVERLLGDAARD